MTLLRTLRFRIRALLDRRRMDAEIDEELRFHIEEHVANQVRLGVPEAEARRVALTQFGGAMRLREDTRDAEGYAPIDVLAQHARHALRMVRRAPVFTALVTLTLGLGIGANGAMFGIIDRLLLRGPDGIVAPNELRRAYVTTRNAAGGVTTDAIQPYALYTLLRADTTLFASAAAYTPPATRDVARGGSTHIAVEYATATLFPTLGAKPYLGRFFSAEEDRPPQGASVVVLGYGYWLRQFAADPAILGRQITVDDQRLTVIGVADPRFTGPDRALVNAWIPMSSRPGVSPDWSSTWFATWAQVVGRVRPGIATSVANERVTAALRAGYTGNDPQMRHSVVTLRPISFDRYGNEPAEYGVARLLYAVAIIVLLIAAANVANLLIARAMQRQREYGLRIALGASTFRLASMMLAESGLLAIIGGLAGIALGYWGGALIRETLLPTVAWASSPVDGAVLAYTAAVVLATTLFVGIGPAFHASRGDPMNALKTGLAQSGDRHGRTRTALQIAQVALSVVLLSGAGLFVRSLWRVRGLDLGLEPDAVVTASVAYNDESSRSPDKLERAVVIDRERMRQLREQVSRMPEVARAAIAIGTPFYSAFGVGISIPGRDSLPHAKGGGPFINAVGPDYFATVGTHLLRGRVFNSTDREGSPPVVIVNEVMARTFWPNEDPLTKCLNVQGEDGCAVVVGIVANARQWKLREDPAMQFYVPYGQEHDIGGATLLVRPNGNVDRFAETLRATLTRWVPNARLIETSTLEAAIDPQIRPWRVGALMFGLFGVLALVVAAVGLFSVVSYILAQRTKELGVRIALGAQVPDVLRALLAGSFLRALIGVVLGVATVVALAPTIQPYLFDTRGRDPAVLLVVAVAMFLVTMLASVLPAMRACRVDPVIALRLD